MRARYRGFVCAQRDIYSEWPGGAIKKKRRGPCAHHPRYIVYMMRVRVRLCVGV